MAPSMASHAQSIPCKASYAPRPLFHNSRKTSAAAHSWKRRWAELLEQMPVSFSAFHWHPVRSTKKMASIALRSSTRERWHPRGCGLRGGSSSSMRSHNSSGMRQSRQALSWSSVISEAPVGEDFPPTEYHQNSLLGYALRRCAQRSRRSPDREFPPP